MGNQHAYATTNLLTGLAGGSFTWSAGSPTNVTNANDGRMDQVVTLSSVASTVNVIIDLGSAKTVNAIALLNTNIASAAAPTIQIDSADDAAFTVNHVTNKAATTPNAQSPQDREHVLQFAALSKRYWKVTWAWTGSFALSVGEIYFANTVQPARYTAFGDKERPEYLVDAFRGYTGESRRLFLAGPIRTKTLRFEDLSTSDRDDYATAMASTKGGALPILFCYLYEATSTAAPTANQDCLFGVIESPAAEWTGFDYQRYNLGQLVITSYARDVGH